MPADSLRVGVLLDALVVPRWVYQSLARLRAEAHGELVLVVDTGHWEQARGVEPRFLYRLYTRLDRAWFRRDLDPLDSFDVHDLVAEGIALLGCGEPGAPGSLSPEECAHRVRAYDLDVLVAFTDAWDLRPFRHGATRGVWFFAHGTDHLTSTGPLGFWETVRGDPVAYSALRACASGGSDGDVLVDSFASASPVSMTRTNHDRLWQASGFVSRALARVGAATRDDRETQQLVSTLVAVAPAGKGGASLVVSAEPRGSVGSTSFQIAGALVELGARVIGRRLAARMSRTQWFLAYGTDAQAPNPHPPLGQLDHLVPPPDRFWADPFPVLREGKRYLFFEEFPHAVGKGHISVIVVDEGARDCEPTTVLTRDYHLAYPSVFMWQEEYFMLPDSGANRTVDLYRCLDFPSRWTHEARLLDGLYAVDPTLVQVGNTWWLFTSVSTGGTPPTAELHLFWAESPLGPWTPHKANPVKSDVRSARPAGRLFRWRGDLYRPAQDCAGAYGRALSFQKVVRLDVDGYAEVEVASLQPSWAPHLTRTHTYNACDGLIAVDGAVERPRFLASVRERMRARRDAAGLS